MYINWFVSVRILILYLFDLILEIIVSWSIFDKSFEKIEENEDEIIKFDGNKILIL